ncbi:MAG: NAD(P)H-hydrate dehydratase, partial [Xanthomonadaceae bacterium]|nr:NAD(P)H-hydrate dehydratase [Xanthomonadaceae bacterium]
GAAVRAHRTVTFIGLKLGFYVGAGPDHVGTLVFDDLQIRRDALAHVPATALRLSEDEIGRVLPPRPRTAHKGQNGDVLVVGGGVGMAGAARLAGEAALRSGAGRVTVATRPENVGAIVAARPELMCRGVASAAELGALIERADVLAVGPGLGQDEWSQAMLEAALNSERRAVFDADALNLLARQGASASPKAPRVLTPHPGEAGRLLGKTTEQVQSDRIGAASAIAARFDSIVVLKGAASVVVSPGALPSICDRGNPGMASPGMGDVLTGVVAGVMAQAQDTAAAVRVAVLAHAMAGDLAARRGERGLIASDLFEYLPTCLNRPQLA